MYVCACASLEPEPHISRQTYGGTAYLVLNKLRKSCTYCLGTASVQWFVTSPMVLMEFMKNRDAWHMRMIERR